MKLITIQEVKSRKKSHISSLPSLSRAQFKKILAEGSVRMVTDASLETSQSRSKKTRAAIRKEFKKLSAQKPKVAAQLKGRPGINDYLFKTKTGAQYSLLNPEALQRDFVLLKRLYDSPTWARDLYAFLYPAAGRMIPNTASSKVKTAKKEFAQLKNPLEIRLDSQQEFTAQIDHLAKWLQKHSFLGIDARPIGYPTTCSAEEGTGFGGDMDNVGPVSPNPNGLITNCWWSLKYYNTCVRDQGDRGTCTAFGAIAAVESAIAVKYGKWVNLSEQDLYKYQRLDWSPPGDYYDDGYIAPLSLLLQMVNHYIFPFERDWDYNQSLDRTADDSSRSYTDSCVGYRGEACSDTNHQAHKTCYRVETKVIKEVVETVCTFVEQIPLIGNFIGEWVCEPVTRQLESVKTYTVCVYKADIPRSSGYRVINILPAWDSLFNTDLTIAKSMLAMQIPLIFCFNVPDSFDAGHPTNGKGFVKYNANEIAPKDMGGHCAMLTGAIDNANLPSGVATGDGGGYFILKNSWGRKRGDCGYYYLPYAWVKKWGKYMIAPQVGLWF